MMTQSDYIAAAFARYFPTSSVTVDDETDDETIHVHVVTSTGHKDHFNAVSWSFTAGSDDDRYVFIRKGYKGLYPGRFYSPDDVITIPLMPEEA